MSDATQGSAAWLFERVGFCTASRFGDVMAKLKNGGYKAERNNYLWELVIERLTGQPSDHFTSSAMQWGIDTEPVARMAYEAQTGAMVEATGFLKHTMPFVGGSPDGTIGDDGGIEIKCPYNSAVHLNTVLNGMPAEHMGQVQGLLWITGRAWWDFVSYDPRLPAHLKLYIKRVLPDAEFIATMQAEITVFLQDVQTLVDKLGSADA